MVDDSMKKDPETRPLPPKPPEEPEAGFPLPPERPERPEAGFPLPEDEIDPDEGIWPEKPERPEAGFPLPPDLNEGAGWPLPDPEGNERDPLDLLSNHTKQTILQLLGYPKNCIVKGTIFYNNTINDYLIVQDLDIAHIIEAKVVELTDIQGYQAKMSSTVHLSKVETIGFSVNAVKDLKTQFDIKARELAAYLHIEYRGGQSSSMMCIGV